MDECNLFGQEGLDLGICLADVILGTQYGAIDALHDAPEILHRALSIGHHTLPVPLIDIERVQVVQLLVSADGVHIGDDAVALGHLVLSQRHTLPLCKRVYHLGLSLGHILYGKCHGALRSAQVVVHAESLQHKERCRHTAQAQFG